MRRLCVVRKKQHFHIIQTAILCTFLLLTFLDIWPPFFEPIFEGEEDEEETLSTHKLREAFDEGVEKLEYLYSAQMGKAKMSELVERNAIVEKMRQCGGTEQKRTARSREWTKNGQLFVYSAYLDGRKNSVFSNWPSVQVLISSFGIVPLNHTFYCHFRHYLYQTDVAKWVWQGTVVRAHVRWIWQRAWDPRTEFYNTFLITCPMTTKNLEEEIDSFILISRNSFCVNSDQSIGMANFTKIIKPNKNLVITDQSVFGVQAGQIKIAVCTKGLSFLEETIAFSAQKVVEWVLLQRSFGANDVTLYIYWIPQKVRNALRRMANKKQLEIVELNLPGNSPNHPFLRHQFIQRNRQQKRRHELIPYNDCFSRYSATHHFVLICDIDEVVVPLRHHNWQQLLHELVAQGKWRAEPSSISIRNVFKFWRQNTTNLNNEQHNANKNNNSNQAEDTKNEDSLFSNKWRTEKAQPIGQYGKSFVNTRSVASVFNHFGLHRLHANVANTLHVGENDALKLHWREKCPEAEFGTEKCQELAKNVIIDTLLDRFREKIEGEKRKAF
ncbi:hypothetical protein niasHT_013225 [Heterodera trifolii]|uniref:Glycosyltransferase family 92 protein n=1 Tax=Heterodera trifolii TaxID=157864 RepID=A0ABD2KXK6_9BILA